MHPLFSSHIVSKPSLRILPTISLVDPPSYSQLFQLPSLHVFGNWCIHACHDHTTTDGFELSSIFTTTPTLSRRTSVDTLSSSLTSHIILIMRNCIPRNLASFAILSSCVLQQFNKTVLIQHR